MTALTSPLTLYRRPASDSWAAFIAGPERLTPGDRGQVVSSRRCQAQVGKPGAKPVDPFGRRPAVGQCHASLSPPPGVTENRPDVPGHDAGHIDGGAGIHG